jgi:hypothetical protein
LHSKKEKEKIHHGKKPLVIEQASLDKRIAQKRHPHEKKVEASTSMPIEAEPINENGT